MKFDTGAPNLVSLATLLAAIAATLYFARLLFAAGKLYMKVGWGDFALVYVQRPSISIFLAYTVAVLAISCIARHFNSSALNLLTSALSGLVLIGTLAFIAFGIIGIVQ